MTARPLGKGIRGRPGRRASRCVLRVARTSHQARNEPLGHLAPGETGKSGRRRGRAGRLGLYRARSIVARCPPFRSWCAFLGPPTPCPDAPRTAARRRRGRCDASQLISRTDRAFKLPLRGRSPLRGAARARFLFHTVIRVVSCPTRRRERGTPDTAAELSLAGTPGRGRPTTWLGVRGEDRRKQRPGAIQARSRPSCFPDRHHRCRHQGNIRR
jgi:hypothetical protein